ncbi:hypothetical protein PPERSA_06235 [Pseudocohnilembus persalinus]|uniref:Uncharacterized protein n=1 Tax=Pseudocohnilembus persalinus TaxID=266149 RepID=A0A0V0QWD9_PSEPJ|nr:hypothetical protein PPERSA_06235 [Pseudocohnilembus persalinus]|eukprot:KRX06264.1 hypothetical protein PPERSA_06235 [Pseudocohnilembus persalinus]
MGEEQLQTPNQGQQIKMTPLKYNKNFINKQMSASNLSSNNTTGTKMIHSKIDTNNNQYQNQDGLLQSRYKVKDNADLCSTYLENSTNQLEIEKRYKNLSLKQRIQIEEQEKREKLKNEIGGENDLQIYLNQKQLSEEDRKLIMLKKKNKDLMSQTKDLNDKILSKMKVIMEQKKLLREVQNIKQQQDSVYAQKLLLKSYQLHTDMGELKKSTEKTNQKTEQMEIENTKIQEQIDKLKNELAQNQEKLEIKKKQAQNMKEKSQKALEYRNELKQTVTSKKIDFLKKRLEIKVIQEQILNLKKQTRTFCILVPHKSLKNKNIFDYENFYKIWKTKNSVQLLQDNIFTKDEPINSKMSSSLSKSKTGFSMQLQDNFKFDNIIERSINKNNPISFLYEDDKQYGLVFEILQDELDLFLKGILYKKMSTILRKISFNSQEFHFIYNINNDKLSLRQNSPENQNLDQFEKQEQIKQYNNNHSNFKSLDNYQETFDLIKEKRQSQLANNLNQNNNVQLQNQLILITGDKNRGVLQELLKILNNIYNGFDNALLSVNSILFNVVFLDKENQNEQNNFEYQNLTPHKLIGKIELDLKEKIYKENILVTGQIQITQYQQVENKQNQNNILNITNDLNANYTKSINILLLENQIEKPEIFSRQFKLAVNKDIIPNKLKLIEKIEPFIRGQDKHIQILELPELIKNNQKKVEKFLKIKQIMETFNQIQIKK